MRQIAFSPIAFQEYNRWFLTNIKITERIKVLIRDIQHDPFRGIGKPEPLKGNWKGFWSRRIDHENRLIHSVTETQILIVKCVGHIEVASRPFPVASPSWKPANRKPATIYTIIPAPTVSNVPSSTSIMLPVIRFFR
jgi:toxin YoeB